MAVKFRIIASQGKKRAVTNAVSKGELLRVLNREVVKISSTGRAKKNKVNFQIVTE